MKQLPVVAAIVVVIALGAITVVYGGADDSPGLQLIGVVLIAGAAALGVKAVRTIRRFR